MRLCLLPAALLLLLARPARADVSLPRVFADNMVLQQQTRVAVWGWADPGEQVTVTAGWARKPLRVTADAQGHWQVQMPTTKAGGPYTLTFQGKNRLTLQNVLLGEVWLCGGQSNMVFPISRRPGSGSYSGVVNEAEVKPRANYPQIRMLTVTTQTADTPQRDLPGGSWTGCSPETVGEFSAVAYFFAQEIYERTRVPIGLINATWGGTPAEAWTRREVLEADPELRPIIERYQRGLDTYPQDYAAYKTAQQQYKAAKAANPQLRLPAPKEPLGPGSNKSPYKNYNAMIHPLVPYTLRGVIWYQGESNADRGYQYRRLFPALIRSWRQEWGQPDLPFYFVQIAPHRSARPELREAQLLTMQTVARTGMAVITDAGDSLDIHPRNKQVVGHRLAQWALAKEYGEKKRPYSGPIYESMQPENGRLRLRFRHADGGLVAQDGPLREFLVAGSDSVFHPAQARIEGRELLVWSDAVKQPVAVRFAWRPTPFPNLYNAAGLPASPFRTDQWHAQ